MNRLPHGLQDIEILPIAEVDSGGSHTSSTPAVGRISAAALPLQRGRMPERRRAVESGGGSSPPRRGACGKPGALRRDGVGPLVRTAVVMLVVLKLLIGLGGGDVIGRRGLHEPGHLLLEVRMAGLKLPDLLQKLLRRRRLHC